MEKILLLISTLSTIMVNGQTSLYRSFPTNQGDWIYRYYDDFGIPTSTYAEYILSGDTLISTTLYKKIYSNSIYLGAMRESAKIVYFIPDTASSEYVLYDFNLVLGDTIIHPFGGAVCSNDTITTDYVDSVLVSDGYHRQLHLSSFVTWIEGIGSTAYLLQPANIYCVSGNFSLQCMMNDSAFVYPSNASPCFLSLEENIINDPFISIFPNPSFGKFSINAENGIKEFFLFDLLGNVILHKNIINQKIIIIDNLKSRIYILNVIDNNNQTKKLKIISSY